MCGSDRKLSLSENKLHFWRVVKAIKGSHFVEYPRQEYHTFRSETIECESNRMGKTRNLFKKIRDTQETFHAKMGLIKDRNCMDLTVAEDTTKRWEEYTEELYKNDLHDPNNHNGMIAHLEPDILQCEVKWALRKHHYKQS